MYKYNVTLFQCPTSCSQYYLRMDELEQKCYDLDTKVRRVEEERDAVMHENDELQDQISTLKTLIEGQIY